MDKGVDALGTRPIASSLAWWDRPRCQRRTGPWTSLMVILLSLCGGGLAHAVSPESQSAGSGEAKTVEPAQIPRMWMTVGERRFSVTLANTDAARSLTAMLPLSLDMEELNGNEKKKDLPNDLPTNAARPGTIRSGDLLLWGNRTVVVFYLTFDSPYAYTRLGRVDDPVGLAKALGSGNVRVLFSDH